MDDRRKRFEADVLPHLDAAYNLARWLARAPADAEDIVQDAMLRAYRGFDGLRGADAKPWLLAIVRNCWRSLAQDTKRRGHVALSDEDSAELVPAAAGDPEMDAVRASEGRSLDRILQDMPDAFREVVILREMEELSYREIAEIAQVPIGTVMSRLARARALLRDKWLAKEQT